jgi:hypothetical protein
MGQFIGDEIDVHFDKKPGPPSSFTWRELQYEIVDIESAYRKLDFGKSWRQRRHRDYYIVKTSTDETFRIYFHRGPGKKYWVLYDKLEQ